MRPPRRTRKISAASHALQRGGYGRRRHAQVFGKPRADRDLLFLDDFPDGFEVVFLRDAGFFAAHFDVASLGKERGLD